MTPSRTRPNPNGGRVVGVAPPGFERNGSRARRPRSLEIVQSETAQPNRRLVFSSPDSPKSIPQILSSLDDASSISQLVSTFTQQHVPSRLITRGSTSNSVTETPPNPSISKERQTVRQHQRPISSMPIDFSTKSQIPGSQLTNDPSNRHVRSSAPSPSSINTISPRLWKDQTPRSNLASPSSNNHQFGSRNRYSSQSDGISDTWFRNQLHCENQNTSLNDRDKSNRSA